MLTRAMTVVFALCLALALACDDQGTSASDQGGERSGVDAGNESGVMMADVSSGAQAGAEGPTQCLTLEDGSCDEPHSCALGTDQADCEEACSVSTQPPHLRAVCAWRTPELAPLPTRSVGPGSEGAGGGYGHLTGLFMIPSGADPDRLAARHFRAFVPRSYQPDRPIPLVLMLPGHRVALDPLPDYTQLMASADMEGFIVAFLEQELRTGDQRWAWWTDWPWAQRPDATTHPDLIFIERIVTQLKSEYNIDHSRVLITGHSRGASMALIAAHERPELFSAAVVESGFTEFGYDERIRAREPSSPKPKVILIHGDLDPDICVDCRPGATCAVTGRRCGAIYGADGLNELLTQAGWGPEELLYMRLEGVTHRWQPQLNTTWWRWLNARPNPAYPQQELTPHERQWPTQATLPTLGELDSSRPHAPRFSAEGMTQFSAGAFEMGNPYDAPQPYGDGWFIDQTPLHVAPVEALWMDQREVTVSEYAQYLNVVGLALDYHPLMPITLTETGYQAYEGKAELPISAVSWEEARRYCAWRGKRLPTEAEWELAATGRGQRPYPWTLPGGGTCRRALAFMDSAHCASDALPAGATPDGDSPEGLSDLSGNVAEWVEDSYAPYEEGAALGAWSTVDDAQKVVRGGGLYHSGPWLGARARWSASKEARGQSLGFRCARTEGDPDPYEGLRDALPLTAPELSEPVPSTLAEPLLKAERLVAGLNRPRAMTRWGDAWAFAEEHAGQVSLWREGGGLELLIPNLSAPTKIATYGDGLLIAVEGELLSWREGELSLVQPLEEELEALVADERGAYWSAGGAIYQWALTGEPERLRDVGEGVTLALSDERVLVGVASPATASGPALLSLSRSTGAWTEALTSAELQGLQVKGVTHEGEGALFTLVNPNWPFNGRVCSASIEERASLSCGSNSPPRATEPLSVGGARYWASRRAVLQEVTREGVKTFEVMSQWHHAKQLTAHEGDLYWVDQVAGSLWRLTL